MRTLFLTTCLLTATPLLSGQSETPTEGVWVRFQLTEPRDATWHVRLGGYIHNPPWRLPDARIPLEAGNDPQTQLRSGQWTPWFDLQQHAGEHLHGRLNRAGGVAEFPNVTAQFAGIPADASSTVTIELATAPDPASVAKRWQESFRGNLTSFLVSPRLKADADALESAAEMSDRRLRWAGEATRGQPHRPTQLIVQTSFWSPQREELNLKEAEVLRLLGFNVVGNQMPEIESRFDFYPPGHTHDVLFGPDATRETVDTLMARHAARMKASPAAGVPFGFTDEIVCRPPIGDDPQALAHFHGWLAQQGVTPQDLGVESLTEVVPIETPPVLAERQAVNGAAARRIFYFTSRFRQHAATERIRWHTEALHRHVQADPARPPLGAATQPLTSTLLADHPYFFGSGLGMGMSPNPAWGGYPLACDWFEMARQRAVDLAGIEDWMGLQYMYGPGATFEGFQLMGFQAALFRSASLGQQPVIAWITPSDETNLRLKAASALCQGAKHFFFWTYGPTATSTENYWSDLRGAYDGLAAVTRHLAAAEHILAPGQPRLTRLAILYSIASDLWQPFGYTHMLERRGQYLAFTHEQYLVDFLCEEDVEAGRLAGYDLLITADPCIKESAAQQIRDWVEEGGWLVGSIAAGSRNEFNEPSQILAPVFGIEPELTPQVQTAEYYRRGALNDLAYLDRITSANPPPPRLPALGALGVKVGFQPLSTATVQATFADESPAVLENDFGQGKAWYVGACPGLAYLKEARFVPESLAEQWPHDLRYAWLTRAARDRGLPKPAQLSQPVVECGVYDSPAGTALALANFTYDPIPQLAVTLSLPGEIRRVRSAEHGPLPFEQRTALGKPYPALVSFSVPLGLSDIIVLE